MKTASIFLFLAFLTTPIFSQGIEVGLFLGSSNYEGDLVPRGDAFSLSRLYYPATGIYARFEPVDGIALRLSATREKVSADDKDANDISRKIRNLQFRSNISEAAAVLEIQPLASLSLDLNYWLRPYIFGGIAVFRFNPQAELFGIWHDLQPLSTEGQGTSANPGQERYSLTQLSIPMGAGLKFLAGDRLSISLEVGFRKTFTDYLDDVSTVYADPDLLIKEVSELSATLADRTSELELAEPVFHAIGEQRGDPSQDDWYIFGGVMVGFKLFGENGGKLRPRRRVKCYF